jgi:hypothetical protein
MHFLDGLFVLAGRTAHLETVSINFGDKLLICGDWHEHTTYLFKN